MFSVEKDKTKNLIRLTNIGRQLLPEEVGKEEKMNGNQGRILIEVLGVDRPNLEYLLALKQNIGKKILQKTMETISENLNRFNRELHPTDINFIKNSPQKRLILFPVQSAIADKLALLQHVKQSLSRKFLSKITDRKKSD